MHLSASWIISGIVTECRELTSAKNKDWRGFIVKLASLGATFEVQCSPQQFRQFSPGMEVECHGLFEEQQGRTKFILSALADAAKSGKGGA